MTKETAVTNEPAWITEGRRHIGTQEVPGPATSPVIASWLHKLRAWWDSDEVPWCGVFVAACMDSAGLPLPKNWMRAKAWAEWGSRLASPVPGCVVIFERQGGGHVGFVLGVTPEGNLMVLGGNQGNRVSIAPFKRDRVLAYVWPLGIPVSSACALPLLSAAGLPLSTNEA